MNDRLVCEISMIPSNKVKHTSAKSERVSSMCDSVGMLCYLLFLQI